MNHCAFCRIDGRFEAAVQNHEGTPLCQLCADHDNTHMRPVKAARALIRALGL